MEILFFSVSQFFDIDRGFVDVCLSLPYFSQVAVGETTTTFGVSGAREYAYFLKEISDARRLRVALLDAMERAALPTWTDDERRRMLHFVVCGGGPTGTLLFSICRFHVA